MSRGLAGKRRSEAKDRSGKEKCLSSTGNISTHDGGKQGPEQTTKAAPVRGEGSVLEGGLSIRLVSAPEPIDVDEEDQEPVGGTSGTVETGPATLALDCSKMGGRFQGRPRAITPLRARP